MAAPAGLRIQMQLMGVSVLSHHLPLLEEGLKDLRPAWEEIRDEIWQSEMERFDAEGAFEGDAQWGALTPKYKAWKDRHYPGQPILQLTGALRDSLTGGAESVFESDATQMTIGTSLRTADGRWNLGMLHQTGTVKMEARPPFAISQGKLSQETRIIGIIREHLKGAVERAADTAREVRQAPVAELKGGRRW